MKVFDLDGPVYKIGSDLADAMILSFIWFLFCLPIVTIGASTTTMFYIYGKKARGEDIYIIKDFMKSFKENFLQSIPMTIVFAVMWASVNMYHILLNAYQGEAPLLLGVLAYFFTIEVMIMTIYSFSILSRFHMKTPKILSVAFILAHRHFKQTAMILLLAIAIFVAATIFPALIVFAPVLFVAIASFPLQKVFTEHIKLAEKMTERTLIERALVDEDREIEQEIIEEMIQGCLDEEDRDTKDYLKYL